MPASTPDHRRTGVRSAADERGIETSASHELVASWNEALGLFRTHRLLELGRTRPGPRPLGRAAATKERIVEAAAELFDARGFRAVSADKIIERAGITKITFYRHFPSKDDLIVSYLQRRSAWERTAILAASDEAGGDADTTLRLMCEGIGREACSPGFRGCPFVNAAAEYTDAVHPVREVVAAHRTWYLTMLNKLTALMGIRDPAVADELMMLRDGAMVAGYLGDAEKVGAALLSASRAAVRHDR